MKTYLKLLFIIVSSASVIVGLWLITDLPNKERNGFAREFIHDAVTPIASIKTDRDVQTIIGAADNNVSFSTDEPSRILKTNSDLNRIEHVEFSTSDSLIKNPRAVYSDGNILYLISRTNPQLLALQQEGKPEVYKLPGLAEHVAFLENGRFIMRSRKNAKTYFYSYYTKTGSYKTSENLRLTLDSTLHADGQLISDPVTKLITYVPYYHNAVVTFDSVFNQIASFKTIDTVSARTLMHKSIKSAPLVTNQKSTSFNGLLFVASNLKADNEPLKEYRKKIPIDVYNNHSGKYLYSFYIPLSDGKLIKSFRVLPRYKLVVLYHDTRISTFQLNQHKLIADY